MKNKYSALGVLSVAFLCLALMTGCFKASSPKGKDGGGSLTPPANIPDFDQDTKGLEQQAKTLANISEEVNDGEGNDKTIHPTSDEAWNAGFTVNTSTSVPQIQWYVFNASGEVLDTSVDMEQSATLNVYDAIGKKVYSHKHSWSGDGHSDPLGLFNTTVKDGDYKVLLFFTLKTGSSAGGQPFKAIGAKVYSALPDIHFSSANQSGTL